MLASANIANSGLDTQVYKGPPTGVRSTLIVNLCNRSGSPILASISIGSVNAGSPASDGSQYLEFNVTIPANSSFQERGIIVLANQPLFVRANVANALSAVVMGIEE